MPSLRWLDRELALIAGETIASALNRAGIVDLGHADAAPGGRVFCGIGACQNCLVETAFGERLEACLTVALDGMALRPLHAPIGGSDDVR